MRDTALRVRGVGRTWRVALAAAWAGALASTVAPEAIPAVVAVWGLAAALRLADAFGWRALAVPGRVGPGDRVDVVDRGWGRGHAVRITRTDGTREWAERGLPRELAEYHAGHVASVTGAACGVPSQVLGESKRDLWRAPVVRVRPRSRRTLVAAAAWVVALATPVWPLAVLTLAGLALARAKVRLALLPAGPVVGVRRPGGWSEAPGEVPRLALDDDGRPVVVFSHPDGSLVVFAAERPVVATVARTLGLDASRPTEDATPRGATVRRNREREIRVRLPQREWVWLVAAGGAAVGGTGLVAVGLSLGAGPWVAAATLAGWVGVTVLNRWLGSEVVSTTVEWSPGDLRADGRGVPVTGLRWIEVRRWLWRAEVVLVRDAGVESVASDLRWTHADDLASELGAALGVEVRGVGRPLLGGADDAMELEDGLDQRRVSVWSGVRPARLSSAVGAVGIALGVAAVVPYGWVGWAPLVVGSVVVLGTIELPSRYTLRFTPAGIDGTRRSPFGSSQVRIPAQELLPARVVRDVTGAAVLEVRSARGTRIELVNRPLAELHRVASWVEEVRATAAPASDPPMPSELRALTRVRR